MRRHFTTFRNEFRRLPSSHFTIQPIADIQPLCIRTAGPTEEQWRLQGENRPMLEPLEHLKPLQEWPVFSPTSPQSTITSSTYWIHVTVTKRGQGRLPHTNTPVLTARDIIKVLKEASFFELHNRSDQIFLHRFIRALIGSWSYFVPRHFASPYQSPNSKELYSGKTKLKKLWSSVPLSKFNIAKQSKQHNYTRPENLWNHTREFPSPRSWSTPSRTDSTNLCRAAATAQCDSKFD